MSASARGADPIRPTAATTSGDPAQGRPGKGVGPVEGVVSTASIGPDVSTHAPAAATPPPSPDTGSSSSSAVTRADDTAADGRFGITLEPVLRRACDDRLSEVNWFRTDWQRGGALTGYATFAGEDGAEHEVVVKLPVPPAERQWLTTLQEADHVVPHVYAHGAALNGYDLAWVVMERLPHGPLGAKWAGKEFDLLVEAAGRFYLAAEPFPHSGEPLHRDWEALFDQARQAVRNKAVPDPQRWSKALKKARRKLKKWIALWENRPIEGWCHGDLHLGNALTRTPPPHGPALLIDFARTRVGHWLEDAVYFEHLFWARPERLHGRKLCKQIAHERKRLGLPVDKDWARRAEAKRALLAMSTPAELRYDGDPRHLAAALEVLERAV